MQFELDPEQQALQDSVRRLLTRHYGFEQRRSIAATEDGFSRAVWRQLAELGTCSLLVPEAHGGFGGTAVDLLAVLPELGRSLALEPFLASAVLGATAFSAASAEMQGATLPAVATGELVLAWAHDEEGARHLPLWIEATARRDGDCWHLHGAKWNVLHGGGAARVVVTARVAGEPADPDGIALFLLDPSSAGVSMTTFRLVDDTPAAEFRFDHAAATPLCLDSAAALATIARTHAVGIAAVCGDAVGAMEAALALTVAYVQTRKQFGRTIGENQALRHRLAEMTVSLEMCRSMAIAAAVAASGPSSAANRADLARAKLMVGRHGRSLCHSAIQLHGGIGMTEEYAVGHYLRRVTLLDQLFGDVDAQAGRLAELVAAEAD